MKLQYLWLAGVVILTQIAGPAYADRVKGRVVWVGTIQNLNANQGQFAFRVNDIACENPVGSAVAEPARETLELIVRSGVIGPRFSARAPHFRNSFSTVMSGFLANTHIQLTSVDIDCSSDDAPYQQIFNAFDSQIVIYR